MRELSGFWGLWVAARRTWVRLFRPRVLCGKVLLLTDWFDVHQSGRGWVPVNARLMVIGSDKPGVEPGILVVGSCRQGWMKSDIREYIYWMLEGQKLTNVWGWHDQFDGIEGVDLGGFRVSYPQRLPACPEELIEAVNGQMQELLD